MHVENKPYQNTVIESQSGSFYDKYRSYSKTAILTSNPVVPQHNFS